MLSDRNILERYKKGDTEVLTDVFHEYAPHIARLARYGFAFYSQGRACSFRGYTDVNDQQDLIQEVFVRVFKAEVRQRYDGLVPFDAYVKRVAKNLVIDRLRQHNTDVHAVDIDAIDLAEHETDPTLSADQLLYRKQLGNVVQGFLAQLAPPEREFVRLRFEQGLAQEEVAKQLGMGRRGVRTLETHIRSDLHKELRRTGLVDAFKGSTTGVELLCTLVLMGLLP